MQLAILAIVLGGLEATNITRAYVAGESQYSKAQKAAVHALSEYVRTGNPAEWSGYQWLIGIPRGARAAREALEQTPPDLEAAQRGFVRGFNHPDDVPGLIWMFRHFSETSLMKDQIQLWRYADENIIQIEALADEIHAEMNGARDPKRLDALLGAVDHLDAELTVFEHAFSAAMRRSGARLHSLVYATAGGASVLLWAGALWFWYRSTRQATRARAEIEASARRFRDVAETAGDWIWETDAALRFTFLSERLEEVIGVPRAAFLGKSRFEVALANSDDPRWRAHLDDMMKRRAFREFEYVYPAADGRELHFMISGRPVYDEKGHFAGYRGTGRDVTKEVEAQRRIEEQHRILKATLENMSQGISVFDADLKLIAYNNRVLELLGFPEGMFGIGDPLEKFIRYNAERGEYGEGSVPQLVRERIELARRFEPHSFIRNRPDGKAILVEGVPLPGGGVVTVYTDITEQEQAKQELRRAAETAERADRAKSHFLANMSHELRTPLNAIIGFSDLMRQEMLGPLGSPSYKEYLDDINSSGAHLLALINDILDLSRIEAGHFSLIEEETDVTRVIEDAMKLLTPEAAAAGVRLEPVYEVGLPRVLGDRKRLRQIVVNLASNAIKYSPDGGQVWISVECDAFGAVVIEVADRGPGIAEADMPVILEPFRQAEATIAGHQPGSGLGLPLVKRLTELHGGRFEIDSQLGEGTRARVILPALPGAPVQQRPAMTG